MVELIKNITFVAFDLETTGLTPVVDRIVEIGAVRFRAGEVLDTFQTLVDPEMPISPGATGKNGVTDDMVKGQPTIDKVLPGFMDFLGQDIPMAHHAPFDVGFLTYDISRLNLTPCGQTRPRHLYHPQRPLSSCPRLQPGISG